MTRQKKPRPDPRKPFKVQQDRLYLAFFKPYGVLSQFTRSGTEHETLADFGFPDHVYPVGRLDADSEGLLILTDDTRMNNALLDPTASHSKTYHVQVENVPDEGALDKLRKGVFIQGKKTLPCQAELLSADPALPPRPVPIRFRKSIPTAWLVLTLIEGRNRQVRRMTAAIGCPTLRLVRTAIGALRADKLELEPGRWQKLNPTQTLMLFKRGFPYETD